jgi:ABC-type multidrug transport system ATPase subunit
MTQAAMVSKSPMTLTLSKVRKVYGARRVLRDVSLRAEPGDVVAVTGANGSGKSTLLKIVAGLVRPTSGTVTIETGKQTLTGASERRRIVGYAGQDLHLYPELTGRENLRFFARVRGEGESISETDINGLLVQVGLDGRGDDPLQVYSSGMRQRMRLAFALIGKPDILLLDEPGLALDEKGVELVGRIIASGKQSITLLATNDKREAALGNRTVALGE